MSKKKKPAPEGGGESCPLWYISFADMVSLLMAFFVMLASFSAGTKEDTKYRQFLRSIQEALRFPITIGMGISDEPDPEALIEKLAQLSMTNFRTDSGKGGNDGDGRPGTINTIKRTREGIEFTIGGQIGFDSGSAELRGEAKTALLEIVEYVRGENHKIEVRGHATRIEAGSTTQPDDAFGHRLAYERACAVADFLVSQGIRSERIRRVDCGSSEPLMTRAYDEQTKKANRRVEIIVMQVLVQDFEGVDGEPPAPPVANHPVPTTEYGSPAEQLPTQQVSGVNVEEE